VTQILKACIVCGQPSPTGRCVLHPKPPNRTGTYTRNAAKVRAAAVLCHICGEGARADDPWVADHLVPRIYGGPDDLSNLRAAHRSCNGRRGASLEGVGGRRRVENPLVTPLSFREK
jgi:5-methylcytosine-specific restriction endonuclease McrA